MPPRPPHVRDQLLAIITRWPGLTARQLATRMSRRPTDIMTTLKVAIDDGRVARQLIDDPYSDQCGQIGYFRVTRNPM